MCRITNVRCVPVDLQLRLDLAAPTTGGIVSPENAMRIRTRLALIAAF